jgi:hypothetical protein
LLLLPHGALSPSEHRIKDKLIQGKLLEDETAESLNVRKRGNRYFGKCRKTKENISLLTKSRQAASLSNVSLKLVLPFAYVAINRQ